MMNWLRRSLQRRAEKSRYRIPGARAGTGSQLVVEFDGPVQDLRTGLSYPDGSPIPGFEMLDSQPLTTPGAGRAVVEWRAAADKETLGTGLNDLSRLNGSTFDVSVQGAGRVRAVRVEPGKDLPLSLGAGPHLFLDDVFVAETHALERKQSQPRRVAGPIMVEHDRWRLAPGSVVWDASAQKFRHWLWRTGSRSRSELLLHESRAIDHWPGEPRLVAEFDGFGASVLDGGAAAEEPERRFKLAYFRYTPPPMGICVTFSPDGVRWCEVPGNPVLPFYPHSSGRWPDGVGDIVDPFQNPHGRGYSAFVKLHSAGQAEFGLQSRTVRAGRGVRVLGLSHSPDFVRCSKPRRVFVPDDL